jgi:hypothetical protein
VANLTLTIDKDVLRRARVRAINEGTSVNAVVREHLERYAGESPAAAGLREFLEIAESRVGLVSEATGRSWKREDLYDRRVLRDR